MKRIALLAALLALGLTGSAQAKGAAPVAHPFASFVGTDGFPKLVTLFGDGTQIVNGFVGADGTVPAGADVLIGQGGGCQEQCDVSWTIDGLVVHTGSVASAGSGTLDFHATFAAGSHVARETVTTSKHGVVASSSVASLTLTVA